jgi:exosortase
VAVEQLTQVASRLSREPWIPGLVLLAALWGLLFYSASYSWQHGQYYDYGWYVPPVAIWFFYRKWRDWDTPVRPPLPLWLLGVGLLFLSLPLAVTRTLLRTDPSWATPLWGLAVTVCAVTLLMVWRLAGKSAIPGLIPVLLFALTAVPWPGPVELYLVKWLTEAVLVTCTWVFGLLGQPVTVNGNQLELAGQVVGVTEGCSGIRSTQSFLMVSLFLGEWMRLRVLSRVGMVAIALLTAYVTNVGRASFLAWTRFDRGQEAFDRVHDSAGMVAYVIGAGVMIWVSSRMNTDTPSGRKLKRTQVDRTAST